MPIRNGWLPREGIHADPIGRLLSRTVLNPALTLPLLLLARYTQKGQDLTLAHGKILKNIQVLLALGLWRLTNDFFDRRAVNNWVDDRYDWSKEVILVTGGSDGLGKLMVQLLAERGSKVVVLDIQPLKFEPPSNVFYFQCDIRSTSAISAAAAEIRSSVGHPTILINNAGVARGKTILDSSEADVRFTFDVNSFSHYWLVQAFLPNMIANNHGMVVTVASLAGYATTPQMVDYASSKAAAVSFHEGLSAELLTRYNAPKVRTVLSTPGHMKTALFTGWNSDTTFLMPSLEVETVAEAIVRQIWTGQSGHVISPGAAAFLTRVRSWPMWLQCHIRNGGKKLMTSWSGRQVIDPNEK